MSLSILGVGLPRTGSVSLIRALQILGYNAVHYSPERALDAAMRCSWRVYDDVDAASDFPAAIVYRELLHLYQGTRCILTIREPRKAWLDSIAGFGSQLDEWVGDHPYKAMMDRIADAWWGPRPHTLAGIGDRYERWIAEVKEYVPADRLLILNVCGGAGWEPLCKFLGKPVPAEVFPHENQRDPKYRTQG